LSGNDNTPARSCSWESFLIKLIFYPNLSTIINVCSFSNRWGGSEKDYVEIREKMKKKLKSLSVTFMSRHLFVYDTSYSTVYWIISIKASFSQLQYGSTGLSGLQKYVLCSNEYTQILKLILSLRTYHFQVSTHLTYHF